MKVILNEDIKYLGEEGDVKNVANGYYRNYLGPRHLAVPYNELTAKISYFFPQMNPKLKPKKNKSAKTANH